MWLLGRSWERFDDLGDIPVDIVKYTKNRWLVPPKTELKSYNRKLKTNQFTTYIRRKKLKYSQYFRKRITTFPISVILFARLKSPSHWGWNVVLMEINAQSCRPKSKVIRFAVRGPLTSFHGRFVVVEVCYIRENCPSENFPQICERPGDSII